MASRSGHTQNRASGEQPPPAAPDGATLAKQALAEAMVSQSESLHGGRSYDPQFRLSLFGSLMSKSGDELAAMNPLGPSFVPKALGDSGRDLIFTPVAPCRVVNFVTINPGVNQSFLIADPSPCPSIPFGPATSVMMNIIAVSPAGNGDLRMWPFGTAVPLASVINYGFPGSGFNIANGLAVPICNFNLTGSCAFDITVQADGAAVTLVIDVYGYFSAVRPIQASVNDDGSVARSTEITSVTRLGTGTYEVITTRNITACSWEATIGLTGFVGQSASGEITAQGRFLTNNGLYIQTFNSAGALADRAFHVNVTCPRRAGS
jgi:hypothetical protein